MRGGLPLPQIKLWTNMDGIWGFALIEYPKPRCDLYEY